MSDSIIRQKYVRSPLALTLLGLSFLAVVTLAFYGWHTGLWRRTIPFFSYFVAPKKLEAFIASYGPYAGVVLIAFQALQVIIAPIPGEITGFAGGFLFGHVWGTVLSTIGLTFGSLVAFMIARLLGAPLVEKVVKKESRDKFNEFVASKGLYVVFVLFLIPGFPKDSLCYLLGLTPMGYIPFILINVVGRLPGTLILTLARGGNISPTIPILLLAPRRQPSPHGCPLPGEGQLYQGVHLTFPPSVGYGVGKLERPCPDFAAGNPPGSPPTPSPLLRIRPTPAVS